MPQSLWNDKLSVGIGLIDEQHKMLLKHLADLSEAVENHHGAKEIATTLDFLVDYTEFHFGTEERHMRANDYPEIQHHLAQHAEFKRTLANLGEDFQEEGATRALAESIQTLLINWFLNHIELVDQKLGAFFREKGVVLKGEA
jgi:hemerythrin